MAVILFIWVEKKLIPACPVPAVRVEERYCQPHRAHASCSQLIYKNRSITVSLVMARKQFIHWVLTPRTPPPKPPSLLFHEP